ncbi:LiaF domain-containing protein, partial [Spirillospora sp. NPDC049652]
AEPAGTAPPPRSEPGTVVAIMSETKRGGRWLVEAQTDANALLGKVMLDLRQAVLSQREVTINCTCVLGEIEIVVPPGVRVANAASAVLGEASVPLDDPEDPDPPTVRITGFTLLGKIGVVRREVGELTLSERVKALTGEQVNARLLGREHRHTHRQIHEGHRRAVDAVREERRRIRDERRDHLRALRDERRRGRY